MGPGDSSPRTLRSKIARGAVLLSSGSLAALLVGRSGPGCGSPPAPEGPAPAAAPAATERPAPQPAPTPPASEPVTVQPTAPANEPAPVEAQPPPGANAPPLSPGPADSKNNAGPRYFPASKAGVFIEREPTPQQAPQQQAGPR